MNKNAHTYLDYNASAPVRPQVRDAVYAALNQSGNPSSVHSAGREAYDQLSRARRHVTSLIGALPDQLVFTSGGTESNFLAIKGALARPKKPPLSHIFVGATEHPSVLAAVETTGIDFDVIPVDAEGVIKLDVLEAQLESQEGPCLICVMMANNETGALQPLDDIARIAEHHRAYVHVDAVQAVGKLDLHGLGFGACSTGGETFGLVSLSLSAHKIGGPQGVGALALREGYALSPQFSGGGQEQGRRSGTENMPGIIGFGVAAELVSGETDQEESRLEVLRDELECKVRNLCPEAVFFSENTNRLANTSCFAIAGLEAERSLINFDLEGVCISSGSACSSGKVSQSHVLRAMNISDDIAKCALRVSLGWDTSEKDIEKFISAMDKIISRQKKSEQKNEIA